MGHKSIDGTTETSGYADGVAFDAKVAFFDIGLTGRSGLTTPTDVVTMFSPGRAAGARLHSASWGTEDNSYSIQEHNMDNYIYWLDDFLILVAAGNDGYEYRCVEPAGLKLDMSKPPNYGCTDINDNGMYLEEDITFGNNLPNTHNSPANLKNGVSVGASESHNGDLQSGQRGYEYLAAFSSRGPTQDGRIKPDIVAPGHR